jgi:hypothetical protein
MNRSLYFSIFFILAITACGTLDKIRGVSESIEDSKKENCFVFQYKPLKNNYVFNDSIQLDIKEAFLETGWAWEKGSHSHSKSLNLWKTEPNEKYQFVLILNEHKGKPLSHFLDIWELSNNGELRYYTNNILFFPMDTIPTLDTMTFYLRVSKTSNIQYHQNVDTIGEVIFIKNKI